MMCLKGTQLIHCFVRTFQSYRDNPKVNAILLMKGRLNDWPPLPPLPQEPEEDDDFMEEEASPSRGGNGDGGAGAGGGASKTRNPSGPKARDPYEMDDTSTMLPIFVAIAAFIPLVFCMCKV